jgi:hypothetical protein
VRTPDLSALGTGTAVLVLGVFLLLQANDTIDPDGGGVLAMLGGCSVVALIASSMGRRRFAAAEETEEATVISPALRRETSRLSQAGFALGIVLGAALVYLWANGSLELAGTIALAALVVATAVILISAPFWVGMVRRLGAERVARARADERSEVAAHLHDSVLQTLALIQKRSDDPEQVARLARRQERDLRDWLAGTEPNRPDELLADALRAAAAEIEDSHGVPIEAVVVGDAELDERSRRSSPRAGRRSPMRSSSLRAEARCASTPRSRTAARASSSTIAGPASTPTRSQPTAAASASR